MTSYQKAAHEMSYDELCEHKTRGFCGLPLPPSGAPIIEHHKYAVAGFFLLFCSEAKSAAEGKTQATNFLLQSWGNGLENLLPHIERALGRKLKPEELAASAIQ